MLFSKKLLITLLFLHLCNLAYSQITNTIWGLTLGKSTKQQVQLVLMQKGYKFTKGTGDSYNVKTAESFTFGSGSWNYANFEFVEDRLYKVHFQNNEVESPINVKLMYDKLKLQLDHKYSSYSEKFDSKPGLNGALYFDGNTFLTIAFQWFENHYYVSISYEDRLLFRRKDQLESDEM